MTHLTNTTINKMARGILSVDKEHDYFEHIDQCGSCTLKHRLALVKTRDPKTLIHATGCPRKITLVRYGYDPFDARIERRKKYIGQHLLNCKRCQKNYIAIVDASAIMLGLKRGIKQQVR